MLLTEIFGHLVLLGPKHVKVKWHLARIHHELLPKLSSGCGWLTLWCFIWLFRGGWSFWAGCSLVTISLITSGAFFWIQIVLFWCFCLVKRFWSGLRTDTLPETLLHRRKRILAIKRHIRTPLELTLTFITSLKIITERLVALILLNSTTSRLVVHTTPTTTALASLRLALVAHLLSEYVIAKLIQQGQDQRLKFHLVHLLKISEVRKHAGGLCEHLGCYSAEVLIWNLRVHLACPLVILFLRILVRPSVAGLRLFIIPIVLEAALPSSVLGSSSLLERGVLLLVALLVLCVPRLELLRFVSALSFILRAIGRLLFRLRFRGCAGRAHRGLLGFINSLFTLLGWHYCQVKIW